MVAEYKYVINFVVDNGAFKNMSWLAVWRELKLYYGLLCGFAQLL